MSRTRRTPYYDPPHCFLAMRQAILARAGACCEGSPTYPRCRVPDGSWHPASREVVQLTLVQLEVTPDQMSMETLRAWCQRCRRAYSRARRREVRTSWQREMDARQLSFW